MEEGNVKGVRETCVWPGGSCREPVRMDSSSQQTEAPCPLFLQGHYVHPMLGDGQHTHTPNMEVWCLLLSLS